MSSDPMLPESFLHDLVAEFENAQTIGLALLGSHARQDATRYSDVDIVRFNPTLPEQAADRYTLVHWGGQLISLSTTTVAQKQKDMQDPAKAIWTVPGLRQMRILTDRNGALEGLQQQALDFTWEPLQAAADEHASYTVMGFAEEVHKILSGLTKADESAILYGTWGLVAGLTEALLVQRGVLLTSENAYFRQAQEEVGRESDWAHYLRLAAGFELGDAELSPVEIRGIAGLHLYRETARLLHPVLDPAHLTVINFTLAAIHTSNFQLTDEK